MTLSFYVLQLAVPQKCAAFLQKRRNKRFRQDALVSVASIFENNCVVVEYVSGRAPLWRSDQTALTGQYFISHSNK